MFNLRDWRRILRPDQQRDTAPRLTRKRDIIIAFAIVSLPLLAIALTLIGFIFDATRREKPDASVGTDKLPVIVYDTASSYYTGILPGRFLLLGSWASNVSEVVVAPFMLIFSYAVACEVLRDSTKGWAKERTRPPFLSEIMRGGHVGLWHWGGHAFKHIADRSEEHVNFHIVNVAGLGLLVASCLTLLVIVGDNWLHVTTHAVRMRHFEPVSDFSQINNSYLVYFDVDTDSIAPSFDLLAGCIGNQLPQDISSAPPPCSLNETNGITNVANPSFVYQTIGQGISQVNSSFNAIDFNFLDTAELEGDSTPFQVVTTFQNKAFHSIFFNPNTAEEQDLSDFGLGSEFGFDYIANTISMTTQCIMATRECDIIATKSSINVQDQNNLSIPYNCYDDFSGNLGRTPLTGHERAQGWNTSFYSLSNDTPRNIPVQAQSNPFTFYVAAAVNSVDFTDLQAESLSEVQDGSLVDVGAGFSAFAMKCEATIYDVQFALINGSFFGSFETNLSTPEKASIIKAPLQVGFGNYHLYEAAQLAVLSSSSSIADHMSTAFSQTGMALASGAFNFSDDAQARLRWTVQVTKVNKAPFWFLVVVCLVYSVFGMAMTGLAFFLRRSPELRDQQARLMAQWGPESKEMDAEREEERKERGKHSSVSTDGDSLSVAS